jgi:hypothetical protein
MNRSLTVLICIPLIVGLASRAAAQTTISQSAWREGQPRACLKNGDALLGWFKDRAKHLGPEGKMRLLIIGDSLSDGGSWAQYFRRGLQAVYGDGGPGNIWPTQPGSAPGQGWAPEWLFSAADFTRYIGPKGVWRDGWSWRGDIWPYLGLNGGFLATDSPEAEYFVEATGSRFTVVHSSGTFTTFDGQPVENRTSGFTATCDDQSKVVPPSAPGEVLDIGLTRFQAPEGPHLLHIHSVNGGTLYFHGLLVEKAAPGIVVYNLSRGGYAPHNFIWRQPGWEKVLTEINPDLTIIFLSKPESGASAGPSDPRQNVESEMLVTRITNAVPQTKLLFVINWAPRDGASEFDAQAVKSRIAWYESRRFPYLNLEEGLDSVAMKELGWFSDGIHVTPAGGQGIGEAVTKLFLP